jgi:hypothetical protein
MIISARSFRATLGDKFGADKWEGPLAGENGLKGYEVMVNNEIVVLTDGNVFIYTDFSILECYVFNVAAISDNNTILDYCSVAYAPRGRETSNCRRG